MSAWYELLTTSLNTLRVLCRKQFLGNGQDFLTQICSRETQAAAATPRAALPSREVSPEHGHCQKTLGTPAGFPRSLSRSLVTPQFVSLRAGCEILSWERFLFLSWLGWRGQQEADARAVYLDLSGMRPGSSLGAALTAQFPWVGARGSGACWVWGAGLRQPGLAQGAAWHRDHPLNAPIGGW